MLLLVCSLLTRCRQWFIPIFTLFSSNTQPHIPTMFIHIYIFSTSDLFFTISAPLCRAIPAECLARGHSDSKVCDKGELCHFSQEAFHFKPLTFQSQACLCNFQPLPPPLPLCKIISFHICSLLQLSTNCPTQSPSPNKKAVWPFYMFSLLPNSFLFLAPSRV